MRGAPNFRLTLSTLLGLGCLSLGFTIVDELRSGGAQSALGQSEAAAASQPTTAPLTAPTSPSMEAFSEILERPLFVATRRPFAPPPAATDPTPTPVETELQLVGVIIDGADRVVLLQAVGQAGIQRLRQGEAIAGWTVGDIAAYGVRLKRGQDERELQLDYKHPLPAQ